jgi:nuclear pore complex protein Nup93
VDEDDGEGLAKLGAVLENYGKKYFENPQDGNTRKGVWARLLLVCGLFEKAVAALYETVDLQIEAIHLAIALSYYGLLRVTPRQEASDVDIGALLRSFLS